jgi:hypothetical protein
MQAAMTQLNLSARAIQNAAGTLWHAQVFNHYHLPGDCHRHSRRRPVMAKRFPTDPQLAGYLPEGLPADLTWAFSSLVLSGNVDFSV